MKIVHFSDTHLGFSDLDVLNSNGVNLREGDFYKAFSDIIDAILKIKPDFVLHTGDLFHRASPTNRAITFALEQIDRLNRAKIPLILIAGNHEAPKSKALAPILKIFDSFENVYAAYSQNAEIFEFKDINFYALPHINDEKKLLGELDKIENSLDLNKKRILLMHATVGAYYLMHEFGEWVFPKEREYLFEKFDYVALGHWHGFSGLKKFNNVYYAGSSERTSSNDTRNDKGYVVIDLDKDLKVRHETIKLRKFLKFELDAKNLESEIKQLDLSKIEGAIVEAVLYNLDINLSMEIDNSYIKSHFDRASYVKIKRHLLESKSESYENVEAITLQDYFLEYINTQIEDEKQKKRVIEKARELFSIVETGL